MPDNDYSGLAGALAKAQAAFPTIPRNKTVTVQKKAGGSYTFQYAPLDTILAAVRKPLADNGLSILQLLDDDYLVTSLLHASGAMLSGRTPIPQSEGIQAYGSAITYLRRYAIQALLGIAAEEDDDGNQAEGNSATFGAPKVERNLRAEMAGIRDGGLIGTAEKGTARTTDFEVRQSPDGAFLGFRLMDGRSKSGQIIEVYGPMAEALKLADPIGKRLQVWGSFAKRDLSGGGSYTAFVAERIATPEWTLPAPEAESVPLFSEEEQSALDTAIGA